VLNDFIQSHGLGTAYGNTIARRYLQQIKWVQDATSRSDLKRFNETVKLFQQYGNQYDYPYLMLSAQAFQESRLNQTLRSPSGAVGVMQIKPATAAQNPINIRDVYKLDHNIEAGAKFMRFIDKQYSQGELMDPVTKSLFAIASYNAGPEKIQTLRKEAAEHGYNPNLWFNNVEIIASVEIGRETVQYVANIYKYYRGIQNDNYTAGKELTDRTEDRREEAEAMTGLISPLLRVCSRKGYCVANQS
jgi:membrane-bound lytic murein transglycosylase MltF